MTRNYKKAGNVLGLRSPVRVGAASICANVGNAFWDIAHLGQ